MNKKFLSVALRCLVAGCGGRKLSSETYADLTDCPRVSFRPSDQAIIQTASYQKIFKIEVAGYDGNCYFDERVQKNKVAIAPRFKITRLENSNVEDVHFSYYIETAEGPSGYLGRKTYFTEAHINKGQSEVYHSAKGGELSVPFSRGDVDVYVGLNAKNADSEIKIR